MDFGVPGLDGPSQTQPNLVGSGLTKQERSCESTEDHWKCSKLQRTDGLLTPKTMPLHQGTPLLRSNSLVSADSGGQQEHMLSFSSLKSEAPFSNKDGDFSEISALNSGFSIITIHPPHMLEIQVTKKYWFFGMMRFWGYGCGSSTASMHEAFRGPLTPSQLTELQHQALIYKYITCNVAVPSNLIIPLKKSLYPYGFTVICWIFAPKFIDLKVFCLSFYLKSILAKMDGLLYIWGTQVALTLSRGGVAGQMERNGGALETLLPTKSGADVLPFVGIGDNWRRCIQKPRNRTAAEVKNIAHEFEIALVACIRIIWIQDPRASSVMSSTANLKSNNSTFTITKQGGPFAESSQSDFEHVAFDSLVNLSHGSSNMDSKEYGHLLDFTSDQENQGQNLRHRFIDDWPKDESIQSLITWPVDLRSDWTQLSMSNPMKSSEFSSSSSSPVQEKLALSPLRLSCEFGPVVSSDIGDPKQSQAHWIPISWGSSTGGPLGEVITNSASNVGSCKNSSPLSIISEGWSVSPHSGSPLPTGMLQTTPFGSLSNSSSGSSPISENKTLHDGSSLCDDVLPSTLVSSALIPSVIRSL
ncbi:Growth-regulating factor 1, putative isoform 2 [Hibiscus syriacus]|uniref:Growth-regulating factor n=1 Tax=Hibiscus syriacus TaxID=106335 RepID=A0A6A2Y0G8_HIBSY|nr:Growth-regulating factor 1, putative isoform 2 [Hibiscus syriacus]